jgi:hypothetical protein
MEHRCPEPGSEQPATGRYSYPDESSPRHFCYFLSINFNIIPNANLSLSNLLRVYSGFVIKMFHAFLTHH